MARAGVAVVAPLLLQHLAAAVPVVLRMGAAIFARGADDGSIAAFGRNARERFVHDLLDIAAFKRRRDARRDERRAVERFAVMRDARRRPGIARSALGIAGSHQPPGIDENLSADLLGDGASVLPDGARLRRGNSRQQVQIRRMLGADAKAAPPEHADALAGIVHKRLAHILRGRLFSAVIVQRPKEKHGAVRVVVGGKVLVFLHIAADIAIRARNALDRPDGRFHRRAQADAHVHAQEAAVEFLKQRCHFHVSFPFFRACAHENAARGGAFMGTRAGDGTRVPSPGKQPFPYRTVARYSAS